jgi:hypothetical protein
LVTTTSTESPTSGNTSVIPAAGTRPLTLASRPTNTPTPSMDLRTTPVKTVPTGKRGATTVQGLVCPASRV